MCAGVGIGEGMGAGGGNPYRSAFRKKKPDRVAANLERTSFGTGTGTGNAGW